MPEKPDKLTVILDDPNQRDVYEGTDVSVHAEHLRGSPAGGGKTDLSNYRFKWKVAFGKKSADFVVDDPQDESKITIKTEGLDAGIYTIHAEALEDDTVVYASDPRNETVLHVKLRPFSTSTTVTLGRTTSLEGPSDGLNPAIRRSTQLLAFKAYSDFMDTVMCGDPNNVEDLGEKMERIEKLTQRRGTPFPGVDSYHLLKVATEVYVMFNYGVLEDFRFSEADAQDYNRRHDVTRTPEQLDRLFQGYLEQVNGVARGGGPAVKTLPYLAFIRRKLRDVPITYSREFDDETELEACYGILERKLSRPGFFELIWSYWQEEGMLVQTLSAIGARFQNRRAPGRDPLAGMDIDPLRPLSNLLWGYIQDEQHRLTVVRRAYEYDHHYGFTLQGKAVPALHAADTRSQFLEAFHNLLHTALIFYKQDDDTTMKADGFSMLNGLREVHLLLAEGAHNQFGDLPSTARIEMMMQQWILARPEMREFIGGRIMVPYSEPWMDRVDAMKKIQGWTDVSVTYFNDLAQFGEQLLLSIRYGSWSEIHDGAAAVNWARDWRAEVKQYVHAYRAVTGVDLSPEVADVRLAADRYLQPSVHLRRRLDVQQGKRSAAEPPAVAAPAGAVGTPSGNGGVSARPSGTWRERRLARQQSGQAKAQMEIE